MRKNYLQSKSGLAEGLCGRLRPDAYEIESACPWTVHLLRKLKRLEMAVGTFHRQYFSRAAEHVGEQFLYQMSASPEPLVLAMARLELAVMRVRQGSTDEYLVEWDRNPELVFQALRSGGDLPEAEPAVHYRMYISRDIPGLVRCEPMPAELAQSQPA